jgi:protein arginine kinase activator
MDLCEQCKKESAIVHVTRITNTGTTVSHLCEACARENGVPLEIKLPSDVPQKNIAATALPVAFVDKECPSCHMMLSDFKTKGLLGCASCYNEFEKEIDGFLVQMHGSVNHKGKRGEAHCIATNGNLDIVKLKAELECAVSREEFELAALLRDTIKRSTESTMWDK